MYLRLFQPSLPPRNRLAPPGVHLGNHGRLEGKSLHENHKAGDIEDGL